MTNLFETLNVETASNEIKSVGAGVYTPGIYTVVGADIALFEVTYPSGDTVTNAEIVLTTDSGAKVIDELRTKPKSNQTQPDLLNYMYNIALVTDKVAELESLKTMFNTIKPSSYVDKYKTTHKEAKVIKIFTNSKFKVMTYTEVSGSANGIYTSQRLVLNQLFRFLDNASLGEIKDGKEAGGSFAYWMEDTTRISAKSQVKWLSDAKKDERDDAVLQVVCEHIKEGKPFTKDMRVKIQETWDPSFAKQVLSSGGTTAKAVDTSSVDVEDDIDAPF